jgi:adenylosuccinate synthase
MPMTQTEFHHATPVYEYLDGWSEDITAARAFEDLPKNAQRYVLALEDLSGCGSRRWAWARTERQRWCGTPCCP